MIEPDLLLAAYAGGYFPMADERGGTIRWYSPDPRAIIPLDGFRVPRSLRRTVSRGVFELRCDSDFERVIRSCAAREETWISEEIIGSYMHLFTLGFAHSIESWYGDRLAGGLYGVAVGGAFFGESMFSTVKDASKVALVHLVSILRECGFVLLDTQMTTPHLEQFGTVTIPRGEYLDLLHIAINLQRKFICPRPRCL